MPSEAARLDPEGRGAARRGGCFNPPQYRPETNLLGFRVFIWTPAGQVKREALDRARATSTLDIQRLAQAGCSNFAASAGGWLRQLRREQRRRIVQAKAAAIYSLALAERCSSSKLSRRSVCRVKVAAALA